MLLVATMARKLKTAWLYSSVISLSIAIFLRGRNSRTLVYPKRPGLASLN